MKEDFVLERLGLNPTNIMQKLKGVILIISSMLAAAGAIYLLTSVKRCVRCMHRKIQTLILKLKSMIVFNSMLRYFQQSLFTIALNSMLCIGYSLRKEFNTSNFVCSCLALLSLTAFSYLCYSFLKRKRLELREKSFTAKFGTLYIGVKPDNNENNLMLQYFKYYCLRRLAFAGIVAFCQDSLVI